MISAILRTGFVSPELVQPLNQNVVFIMMRIIGKIALGVFSALCVALAGGAIYQFISTQIDTHSYPPPGQLVDVNGYKLHIHCTGIAGPTVVLEAGMGGNSFEWSLVQPEVAKFTRVCSYDRAGNGWSDESTYPRTSSQIVEELHTLLAQANIPGPYILVGHSFGGINVRLYASRYPDEVAGLVLIDASHEDQFQKLPPFKQSLVEKLIFHRGLARFMAFIGAVRLLNSFSNEHEIFPGRIPTMYSKLQSTPKFIGTIFEERRLFPKSLDQLKSTSTHLGNKPLIVISAGRSFTLEECEEQGYSSDWLEQFDGAQKELQKDLTTKSFDSKQIIAANSGHMINRDEPKIIIDAISEIVNKLK